MGEGFSGGGTEALARVSPMLQAIRQPADLRALSPGQLADLAAGIRAYLVAAVSRTGGHLGSNLGSVELTLAVHRVFDSPQDTVLWDTGHQAYTHKLVTGRQEEFAHLRRRGGLSGYPSSSESAHDILENSHASVALSYADGLAKARRLSGQGDRRVVVVVGDGALTGGVAWEALNNLGARPGLGVIVLVNDNGRSYCPTVGGLATHLAGLRQQRTDEGGKAGGAIFTGMGLDYIGPVDGHDVTAVEAALRDARCRGRSVVVHCVTEKGRGFGPAVGDAADRMHGTPPFDPSSGRPRAAAAQSWTSVFGDELVSIARRDPTVVALTAAMAGPVGLGRFAGEFPQRMYDVGIAEQHAIASAAGLALGGLHPVVCLYATFANRAFDQLLMDVALHKLPVTLVLDRAGITGEDGPSHHGMWDIAALSIVPGLRIAAPRDPTRLRELLREAVGTPGPTVVRFPKATVGPDIPAVRRCGSVDVLAQGSPEGVLLLPAGPTAQLCMQAVAACGSLADDVTVVDPRWLTPVSEEVIELACRHRLVVTVEDGCRTGGFGSALSDALSEAGVDVPVRRLGSPPGFLHHGTRAEVLADVGLTADRIAETLIRAGLGTTRAGLIVA